MELASPNNTKFEGVDEWISEVDSKLNSIIDDFLTKSQVATQLNTGKQINKSDTNKTSDLVKSKKHKRKLSESLTPTSAIIQRDQGLNFIDRDERKENPLFTGKHASKYATFHDGETLVDICDSDFEIMSKKKRKIKKCLPNGNSAPPKKKKKRNNVKGSVTSADSLLDHKEDGELFFSDMRGSSKNDNSMSIKESHAPNENKNTAIDMVELELTYSDRKTKKKKTQNGYESNRDPLAKKKKKSKENDQSTKIDENTNHYCNTSSDITDSFELFQQVSQRKKNKSKREEKTEDIGLSQKSPKKKKKKDKSEKYIKESNSNSIVIPEMGANKKKKVKNKDNIDNSNLVEEPSQETQIEENINKFKSPSSEEKSKKKKNNKEEDPLQYIKELFKEHSLNRLKLFRETIEKTETEENMPNHNLPGSNEKSKKKNRDLKPQVEENAIFKSPSPKEKINGEDLLNCVEQHSLDYSKLLGESIKLTELEENVPDSNEKSKKKNRNIKQDEDPLDYNKELFREHQERSSTQSYFEILPGVKKKKKKKKSKERISEDFDRQIHNELLHINGNIEGENYQIENVKSQISYRKLEEYLNFDEPVNHNLNVNGSQNYATQLKKKSKLSPHYKLDKLNYLSASNSKQLKITEDTQVVEKNVEDLIITPDLFDDNVNIIEGQILKNVKNSNLDEFLKKSKKTKNKEEGSNEKSKKKNRNIKQDEDSLDYNKELFREHQERSSTQSYFEILSDVKKKKKKKSKERISEDFDRQIHNELLHINGNIEGENYQIENVKPQILKNVKDSNLDEFVKKSKKSKNKEEGSNEKSKKKNRDIKQDEDSLEYNKELFREHQERSSAHQSFFEIYSGVKKKKKKSKERISEDFDRQIRNESLHINDNIEGENYQIENVKSQISYQRFQEYRNFDELVNCNLNGKAKLKEDDDTSDTSIDNEPVKKVRSKKNKRKSKKKENSSLSDTEEDITCENSTNISVEDLSKEHKKNKTFTIKLPSGYKVPPLHRMKRASKYTEEELKLAKSLNGKFGVFSQKEDEVIIKNWKSFCKSHELPEDPKMFLKLSNIINKEERKTFLQFLSQGLEKRLPLRVYERFKTMYDKVQKKQGRYTKLEDKKIIEFMSTTDSTKHHHDCGILLNRSAASIEKRYYHLITNENKTPVKWDRQMSEKLIRAMLQVAETDNVKVLKSMEFTRSQWNAVSYLLGGIPVKKIGRAWKVTIYPRLFSRKDREYIKRTLIAKMLENGENDFRAIVWKNYSKLFKGVTPSMVGDMFRIMMAHVPTQYKSNLKDSLEYLSLHATYRRPRKQIKYRFKNGRLTMTFIKEDSYK